MSGLGVLVALPHGLNASGVTLWAARMANALAARRIHVGLILHPEPPDQAPCAVDLDERIGHFVLRGVPPLDAAAGDLSPYIPVYRDAVRRVAGVCNGPVVLCPNLHGDCYGIAATLALVDPELVRVVAWQHTDQPYDLRLMAHYEPIVSRFVAISSRIEGLLRQTIPGRDRDVVRLAHGVPVPDDCPTRAPRHGRPLRLVYTGRVEHAQKRTGALVELSEELRRRGVDHELTIVGDGPAWAEIAARAGRPASDRASHRPVNSHRVRLTGPLSPDGVATELIRADAFVLASRYEGLSVAMLEAMAHGCVPVVTRVDSGAPDVIGHGVNGLLVDAAPDADERAVASAFADAITATSPRGWNAMAREAWRTARERFSLEAHADGAESILRAAAASPARPWPAARPCAFTAATGQSGGVPADGAGRVRTLLESLAGRAIVVHGVGRHTRQLAEVFACSPARIAAFTDDDPRLHGTRLWNWPILAPAQAAGAGATDAVISSWMHEGAIWARRDVYERAGIRVHRVYSSGSADSPAAS